MNGLDVVRGLIARGYSPHAAAALAGHMGQESGFNPAAVNEKEGANGLLQWRLDRWQNLQDFAKAQGKSPTDPEVQLDFVGKELAGPEKKAGAGFLAAPDVASASAALKPYIRFGDDSAGTRLNNATSLFAQMNGGPVGALAGGPAPVDPTNPADPTQTAAAAPPLSLAPGAAPVGALGSIGAALNPAAAPGQAQQQPQGPSFLPEQQLQMARPNVGQAQQIAAAIAKQYGIGA